MDFFLNSEYIDRDRWIELVSLGVVAGDGREFYAISTDFDPAGGNDFVRSVVLPQPEPVGHPAWMSRTAMVEALLRFAGDASPLFWSYGSAPLADETDRVLAEKSGPFARASVLFRPESDWSHPLLPAIHLITGAWHPLRAADVEH